MVWRRFRTLIYSITILFLLGFIGLESNIIKLNQNKLIDYENKNKKLLIAKSEVDKLAEEVDKIDSEINSTESEIASLDEKIKKLESEKNELSIKVASKKEQAIINNYKTAYLTFDDGPSYLTPQILDILKKYNAKATFFVVNATEGNKDILNRMIAEGHTIGLHSATHQYSYIYSSDDAYFEDLYRVRDNVKNLTGYMPIIIRFPGGSSNTVSKYYNEGIMSRLVNEVTARGFYYHDWNVDSEDAAGASSEKMIENIIRYSTNKTWVNVLMHDAGSKRQTVEALERIIQWYQANGFHLEALNPSSPCPHHRVNN